MITLHDVYKQGSETVKAAVLAFGARHPLDDTEPDWNRTEEHFTYLIEEIMGQAAPRHERAAATIVRRAEHEAVNFLLAVNNRPDYRCPICVKRRRYPL
ncbi:hypothetical protein ACFU99_08945 [Streptomyces sp. NPDC057654]|uniref:hypothetical protein n=1 Tax=Streptomyces sp. NPDC057654 TaxID=3346196 RepID=UPI0036A28168